MKVSGGSNLSNINRKDCSSHPGFPSVSKDRLLIVSKLIFFRSFPWQFVRAKISEFANDAAEKKNVKEVKGIGFSLIA